MGRAPVGSPAVRRQSKWGNGLSHRRPRHQAPIHRPARPWAIVAGALGFAIAALGIAACGDDDKKSGGASSTAAKPTSLSITTSDAGRKRFAMQAPTSIKGSLVEIRFKNASKVPHEAQLVRIEGSHPRQEVLKVVASDSDRPTKIPEWLHGEGGVQSTPPGKEATVIENLPAGHYLVTDDETGGDDKAPAPSRRGALAELDVTPGAPGRLPATDATIKVVDKGKDEYRFQTSGLKAGANKLLFDNDSKKELHHVVAFPLRPGKRIADVKKFFAQQGRPSGPPPVDFEKGVNTEVLDGKRELVTTLTLRKGDYALVCFINDRDDVKPHFRQGLLSQVTVR